MMKDPKQKKICFVAPHYYRYSIGGAEVQMCILAHEFIRRQWQVHYISRDIQEYGKDNGIILHPFPDSGNGTENFAQLKRILLSIAPDIIYQRGRSIYTEMVGKFCRSYSVPFVFGLSMDIDCRRFRNMLRVFENSPKNIFRRVRMLPYCAKLGVADLRSLKGMRDADLILCQTAIQQQLLKKNLDCVAKVVRNIHNVPKADKKKTEPPVVLWLASVKKWKQPGLFVELAEKLDRSHCRFILAGRMVEHSCSELIDNALSRLNNFHYIEDVDFEESNKLLEEASLFVNTSLGNEGFPNTFIQAWLRKVPTVTLNFDPDNLIKEQRIGRHSENFDNLVLDVGELIQCDEMRLKMGKRARNFAVNEFSTKVVFPGMLSEMSNLIK